MPTEQPAPGAVGLSDGGGVRYRVWAPESKGLETIVFAGSGEVLRAVALTAAGRGYFQGDDPQGRAGDLYKFRLDGDEGKRFPTPFPASSRRAYTGLRRSWSRSDILGSTTTNGVPFRWTRW